MNRHASDISAMQDHQQARTGNFMGDCMMLHAKQASKRRRRSKAAPFLGAAGLSLSLVSGISVAAADVLTRSTGVNHEITLCEEEVSDVSLATFHVFDNEKSRTFRRGVKFAAGGCGCGHG
jgi:hypothetical protein